MQLITTIQLLSLPKFQCPAQFQDEKWVRLCIKWYPTLISILEACENHIWYSSFAERWTSLKLFLEGWQCEFKQRDLCLEHWDRNGCQERDLAGSQTFSNVPEKCVSSEQIVSSEALSKSDHLNKSGNLTKPGEDARDPRSDCRLCNLPNASWLRRTHWLPTQVDQHPQQQRLQSFFFKF